MTEKTTAKKAAPKKAAPKKAAAKKSTISQDKKSADSARRTEAVTEYQDNIPPPTEAELKENERREGLRRDMEANQDEIDKLEEQADILREQNAKILLALYPQQGENDPHHVAVKGFLEASRKERANRASNPAKLKALIANMHKSPIDQAMTRKSQRGTSRPNRPVKDGKKES